MTTAFVLGGGGLLGPHEVGMLRALGEAGLKQFRYRDRAKVGLSIDRAYAAYVSYLAALAAH